MGALARHGLATWASWYSETRMTFYSTENTQGDSGRVARNQIVGHMWKSLPFALILKNFGSIPNVDAWELWLFLSNLIILWRNKFTFEDFTSFLNEEAATEAVLLKICS